MTVKNSSSKTERGWVKPPKEQNTIAVRGWWPQDYAFAAFACVVLGVIAAGFLVGIGQPYSEAYIAAGFFGLWAQIFLSVAVIAQGVRVGNRFSR